MIFSEFAYFKAFIVASLGNALYYYKVAVFVAYLNADPVADLFAHYRLTQGRFAAYKPFE